VVQKEGKKGCFGDIPKVVILGFFGVILGFLTVFVRFLGVGQNARASYAEVHPEKRVFWGYRKIGFLRGFWPFLSIFGQKVVENGHFRSKRAQKGGQFWIAQNDTEDFFP
jgi:hypothetical protein